MNEIHQEFEAASEHEGFSEDTSSPTTAETPDVTRQKRKLIEALTNYLKSRGIFDVANSADAEASSSSGPQQEQQPKKMLWLFNVTHQHTSDQKKALASAAIRLINTDRSHDELTILALAIIAEDMTIEFKKLLEKKEKAYASISGQTPPETAPDYYQILSNYLTNGKTLTLDLARHPNPKNSGLLNAILPLLDGDEGLAPDARKCADVITTFRQLFKITEVGQEFKSKYTHARSIVDKYRHDIIIATYQALIVVENQTLSKFREILLNALVIERRLSTDPNHYLLNQEPIINFDITKYRLVPGVMIYSTDDKRSLEAQVAAANINYLMSVLVGTYGLEQVAMAAIKKPTVKNLFKQDVVAMTDLETFVRKAVEDLDQAMQAKEPKFIQEHLY